MQQELTEWLPEIRSALENVRSWAMLQEGKYLDLTELDSSLGPTSF